MLDKKFTRRAFGLAAAAITLAGVSTFASAQSLPLGPIVKRLKRQYKARVIDARLVTRGGVSAYRIKLLTKKKQLVKVYVNASTGAFIN